MKKNVIKKQAKFRIIFNILLVCLFWAGCANFHPHIARIDFGYIPARSEPAWWWPSDIRAQRANIIIFRVETDGREIYCIEPFTIGWW